MLRRGMMILQLLPHMMVLMIMTSCNHTVLHIIILVSDKFYFYVKLRL
jgi:hypothetical protein